MKSLLLICGIAALTFSCARESNRGIPVPPKTTPPSQPAPPPNGPQAPVPGPEQRGPMSPPRQVELPPLSHNPKECPQGLEGYYKNVSANSETQDSWMKITRNKEGALAIVIPSSSKGETPFVMIVDGRKNILTEQMEATAYCQKGELIFRSISNTRDVSDIVLSKHKDGLRSKVVSGLQQNKEIFFRKSVEPKDRQPEVRTPRAPQGPRQSERDRLPQGPQVERRQDRNQEQEQVPQQERRQDKDMTGPSEKWEGSSDCPELSGKFMIQDKDGRPAVRSLTFSQGAEGLLQVVATSAQRTFPAVLMNDQEVSDQNQATLKGFCQDGIAKVVYNFAQGKQVVELEIKKISPTEISVENKVDGTVQKKYKFAKTK